MLVQDVAYGLLRQEKLAQDVAHGMLLAEKRIWLRDKARLKAKLENQKDALASVLEGMSMISTVKKKKEGCGCAAKRAAKRGDSG